MRLDGCFKVTGTKRGVRTVYVIEPATAEEKKIADAAEQERKEAKEKQNQKQPTIKKKPKPTLPPAPPADPDAEATRALKFAKQYLLEARNQKNTEEADRLNALARKRLSEIQEKFPGTAAAKEAKKLLDSAP